MQNQLEYENFVDNLKKGNICIFETDTVVGIGCSILKNNKINKNINKIFKIKNRKKEKKLPWLISSEEMLKQWSLNLNDYQKSIIKCNWPGATTIILNVNKTISEDLCVKDDNNNYSVAFRIPDCDDIRNAISEIGCPIVCTSANISNENDVKTIKDVSNIIKNNVDYIYNKKQVSTGKASKIISIINEENKTIRY